MSDSLRPSEIVEAMIAAGTSKATLPATDLLIRGAMAGALLGFATSLAVVAAVQTGMPLVGALIFPVGLALIVTCGYDLVTGSFALLAAAAFRGRLRAGTLIRNWVLVFIGNLVGSLFYAVLLWTALTGAGAATAGPLGARLVTIATAKTAAYAALGMPGLLEVFTKAILCNWMVSLAVVMGFASRSTVGKVVLLWLPVVIFFAQGFEHTVVNMFLIPMGMLLGAPVTFGEWWFWNEIPTTLGNVVGGVVFTAGALYATHGRRGRLLTTPRTEDALEAE